MWTAQRAQSARRGCSCENLSRSFRLAGKTLMTSGQTELSLPVPRGFSGCNAEECSSISRMQRQNRHKLRNPACIDHSSRENGYSAGQCLSIIVTHTPRKKSLPLFHTCRFCRQELERARFLWFELPVVFLLLRPWRCPHCFDLFFRPFRPFHRSAKAKRKRRQRE